MENVPVPELNNNGFLVNEQYLRDLANYGGYGGRKDSIRYSRLFFYLWLYLQFTDRPFTLRDCADRYPKSKRQIQRYLKRLIEFDMVEVYRNSHPGQNKLFRVLT